MEDEEINVCLLVQESYLPVPDNIQVLMNYGRESIKGSQTGEFLASGDVCIIQASRGAIRNWLKDFGEIWLSSNPVAGDWEAHSIKEEHESA